MIPLNLFKNIQIFIIENVLLDSFLDRQYSFMMILGYH